MQKQQDEPNPLLRPLLALAELLLLEDDEDVYDDAARKQRAQRRKQLFIEGFRQVRYGAEIGQWETVHEFQHDVEQVLTGGCYAWKAPSDALERARALAPRLVAHVFDFAAARLADLSPEAAENAAAQARELEKALSAKSRAKPKGKAKKTTKKPGKKPAKAAPAKKTAKAKPKGKAKTAKPNGRASAAKPATRRQLDIEDMASAAEAPLGS